MQLYQQAAAIPYRIVDERPEVALVTSASGKRWVAPKGTIDDGEQPWETAAREAEEEAGLLGLLDPTPIGQYHYSKENGLYRVDVCLMRVTVVFDWWLEARRRRRRWMVVEEAAARVSRDLRPFLHAVEDVVQSGR